MSLPTPESVKKSIDAFIDRFDAFDTCLLAHVDPDEHLELSDSIALFAIYVQQME